MSIPYTPSGFISTNSTPAYQNWLSNTPTNFVYIQSVPGIIYPVIVPVRFKDYIGTPEGAQYVAFRIKVQKFYIGANSGVDWLLASSAYFGANIAITALTLPFIASGIGDTLLVNAQNIALLNVGLHEAKVMFTIEGQNTVGLWSELSSYAHFATIKVYENEPITWTPNNFIMNHYQNTLNPSKSITMNGPSWKVTAPNNFILESDDVAVTITSTTTPLGTTYKAQGTGEHIIKLKSGTFYNTPSALIPGNYPSSLNVITGVSTQVGFINFTLNVLSPGDFIVNPEELYFEAAKGGDEPEPISIYVYAANVFTISAPTWLDVLPMNESAPGIFGRLNAVPINSANLNAGNYSGVIILSSLVSGSLVSISIPVVYVLNEFVAVPYSNADFNFTKDPVFLNFFTEIPDTYFDIQMNVQVNDWVFQSLEVKTFIVPFKVPLYKKKQRENIGERIEKMLMKYLEPNILATKQYNAATVSIAIQERKYPSNELVRETTLASLKFLSGITPKNKVGNNAVLEISDGIKRVTANSFDFINLMLVPGVEKQIDVYVNNELQEQYAINSDVDTYRETIFFTNYNLKAGDSVEVIVFLDFLKTQFLSKKYIVYPEPEYSNMILWEDDFKMLQSYEFTGKHTVKNDFSFENFTQRKNLVDYVKNMGTKDVQKITINTGAIPKHDIQIIKNIIKAKRVWLFVNEFEIVELNNETKSLIYDDVDRELNYFDLEFTINKKTNEESNSF